MPDDLSDIRIDRTGPTWLSLKRVIAAEIEKLRTNLEQPFISEEQSSHFRGEIAFARRLIATVEPDLTEAGGQALDYSQVRAPKQQS